MLIQFVVRTIGPILLRGGLGGGGAGGGTTTGTSSRDDDFDDFDDDDDKANEVDDSNKSKVAISLPTFAPDNPDDSASPSPSAALAASTAAPRINLLDDSFDDNESQPATR